MPTLSMTRLLPWLLALSCGLATAAENHDWLAELEQHRINRENNLRHPSGWLSLVGLHWIQADSQRIGSALDNDIMLATGPAHLGVLRWEQSMLWLDPADDADIYIDEQPVSGPVPLQPDSSDNPTYISFANGESGFSLIERSDRLALRVRDAQAPARLAFSGLAFYPPDPAWRIEARFEPHPEGHTIDIVNVLNQIDPSPNPGALVFEHNGSSYRLEAIGNPDGSLFIIFADRTSGRETYGAGRFLSVPAPSEGRAVLDFNRAYNPPCAFTPYSTCPLPPPENRLDLAVLAGEKKYPANE